MPGVTDHDCPLITLDMKSARRHSKQRKTLLYAKANWEKFAEHMGANGDEITAKLHSSSVSELWMIFKAGVENGIDQLFIPQKTTQKKGDLPWVTSCIRRLIKSEIDLARKTGTSKDKGTIPSHMPWKNK